MTTGISGLGLGLESGLGLGLELELGLATVSFDMFKHLRESFLRLGFR